MPKQSTQRNSGYKLVAIASLVATSLLLVFCARLGLSPLDSLCEGVDCDDHGRCVGSSGDEALCICDEGYHNAGTLHCRREQTCRTNDDCDDDGNECTRDSCDESGLCLWEEVDGLCMDDDMCTYNDTCRGGGCEGTAYTCEPGNECLTGICLGVDCGGSCPRSCTFYDCLAQSEIPVSECEALVDLYNSTDGPTWGGSTGWLVTSTPCSWFCMTCASGHVSDLDLQNIGLDGDLPSSIAALIALDILNLSNNQLSGSIPAELANLTDLNYLNLSNNQLSGSS